jgi:hypothetical protein
VSTPADPCPAKLLILYGFVSIYSSRPSKAVYLRRHTCNRWDLILWKKSFSLDQSIRAYEALVRAITTRLSSVPTDERGPITTDDTIVLKFNNSFVPSFLARMRYFRCIAPKLSVYDFTHPPPFQEHSLNDNDFSISKALYELHSCISRPLDLIPRF